MKGKFEKLMLIWLIALLTFDMIMVVPVFSQLPPRFYPRTGRGAATLYITPEYNNFTTPPTTNGTWFTVNVRIANATCVAMWQVELIYKKDLLYTLPANISYAPAADHIFGATYTPVTPVVDVFNATYNYLAHTAISSPYTEYNATDKGLMTIKFQIISLPGKNQTLSSLLYFTTSETPGVFNSYTLDINLDENNVTLKDGYYEIKRPPPIPAYLELSPNATVKPTILGDRILGKPDAFFDVNMLINNVDPLDFLILVQFNVTFDENLLQIDNVAEGTFMNNSTWAPYGTFFFWVLDPGMLTGFIMISPNDQGEWNMTQFPGGSGLLATLRFQAIYQPENKTNFRTSDLLLSGVFDEFFLSANDTWIPYNPPISGTYTINGYDWKPPSVDFTWTPSIPLINQPITFNGSLSYGYRNVNGTLVPDPTYIALYTWSWDDGTPDNATTSPIITHTYTATGSYNTTLTVTDLDGKTSSLMQNVTVRQMYRLTITATLGGTTSPVPSEYLYLPGTNVSVTAIPDAGYYFDHWELDSVNVGSTNPITVTMDTDHLLLAVFSPLYRLTITGTKGGTTNPALGEHLYLPGTNVSVTAIPDAGYYFDHWELDSVNVGSTNPITVTMDTDHLLLAVFSPRPTLQIQADVGSLHFPGETAEFYVLVAFQGTRVNATIINFKVYFGGTPIWTPTGVQPIATGLYRILYPISATAPVGTYTLVVEAEYSLAGGNTLKSFLISPGFGEAGALLVDIKDEIATIIIPNLGQIKANLTSINATISKLIVDSKGEILAKIDTALGPVTTKLNTIGADVTTVKGDTATIKTTLGDIQTSLGSLNSVATTTLYVTSALSAIAAVVAVIILILITRKR